MSVNIAIDGTAGSGKGTIAKRLAQELGFFCLDTGAIYRSVAYAVVNAKINLENEEEIKQLIQNLDFKVVFEKDADGKQVQKNILNGEDLGQKIRTEEISEASSYVAQLPFVREFATKIQHEIAKNFNVIVEGRDIGTVVLPNANFKFFLTASVEVRADRRLKQLNLPQERFNDVLKEIKERDYRDMNRAISPLKIADDAIYVDNSNQTLEETISYMLSFIKI